MQPPTKQPHIVIARSVIEVLQRAAAAPQSPPATDPVQAIGGILIGKRLSATHIAIVGASPPGPAPDNLQMGFALDQQQARATLDEWFKRDPTVDFLGLWHTHPVAVAQPTTGDVEVAQKFLVDPDYDLVELVNLLVQVDPKHPRIQCCYVGKADGQQDAVVSMVPFEVVDDALAVAGQVPTAVVAPLPVASVPPLDAAPSPARDLDDEPPRRRLPFIIVGLLSLIVVLVLGGLALASRPTTQPDPSVTTGQLTTVASVGNNGTAGPTSLPVSVSPTANPAVLPAPTATTGQLPVTTATAEPEQPTAVPVTNTPIPPAAQAPTPSPTNSLPYVLRIEVMDADYQASFLARLRAANCVGCYNIDLIGPEPFQELRITLAGSTGSPFVNYRDPSPLQFPPRPEPYTVQVRDLQGNIVSEPLSFGVTEDTLYVLRITAQ